VSGWRAVPRGGAGISLQVDNGVPALLIDGKTVWQARSGLPAPASFIRAPINASPAACASAVQTKTLESSQ